MKKKKLNKLRIAISEYMRSEGCGCCTDEPMHSQISDKIGKLLKFAPYDDGSGYDFYSLTSKSDEG